MNKPKQEISLGEWLIKAPSAIFGLMASLAAIIGASLAIFKAMPEYIEAGDYQIVVVLAMGYFAMIFGAPLVGNFIYEKLVFVLTALHKPLQ